MTHTDRLSDGEKPFFELLSSCLHEFWLVSSWWFHR